MWLLVNTTIQVGLDELILTNTAMIEILQNMKLDICKMGSINEKFTAADDCR